MIAICATSSGLKPGQTLQQSINIYQNNAVSESDAQTISGELRYLDISITNDITDDICKLSTGASQQETWFVVYTFPFLPPVDDLFTNPS